MHVRVGLVILSFLALGAVARPGAQGPPKPGEAAQEKRAEATSAPYVYERHHVRVRVDRDGRGTRELTWHIRVNDDNGVRQAGQIPLNYAPASDSLAISKLEVRKRDGRTLSIGPEAVQDHAIQPFAGATMFFDLRQKMITVPSLQPGDTILLTALWTVERPLIANQSWFQHTFFTTLIVEDERLEIDVPEGYPVVLRTAPTAPAEEHGGRGEVASGRRVYRWKTSNLKLPGDEEEEEEEDASADAPPADVRFTTFRDWSALAEWFRPLLHPKADSAVRAKAQELTASIPDRDGKIRAIYDYVATQIRYVSLSFGVGRFAPHTPAEVLKNQYGDCKDKHALLTAMLETIGVRAVGVLLNTGRSVSDDMPSPAEFDHVITAVPSGEDPAAWLWLDTTAEIAPPGLLVAALRDKQGLFLGDASAPDRLVKTVADGPFPFVISFELEGDVNPLGVLMGRVRVRARGDEELLLRAAARAVPPASIDDYGKAFFKSVGFEGEISDVKFGDPTATREPFEMSASIRRAGYLDWAAEKSSVAALTGDHGADGLEELKKDRRVGSPMRVERRFRITLPPAYTAAAPVGVSIQKEGLAYRASYEGTDRSILAERSLIRTARTLHSRHAAEYAALARTITSDVAQKFAITSARKTVPAIPADIKASELYSAGYSAYNAKDYETAAQFWKRTCELDPKMASAWSGLGFAYQQLKRYDDAIAAMEKQIELNPANNRAHTDLGFVAKAAGKLDIAARAYAKHVEQNPLDGATHKALGEIHFDREDYAAAIPVLEKAAALEKKDEWIHVLLGASHLRQGDVRRANEAFDRAVALEGTPAVCTKIAWELASSGVESEKAARLLDRATKQIVESTASLAASDVTDAHIDLMVRLAWIWDARGMLAMKKKDIASAIRHFDAAWRFLDAIETAQHLGEAYEAAPHRSSDALNTYLNARSVHPRSAASLDERIRRLAPNIDIDALMKAARVDFTKQRTLVVAGDYGTQTMARFNAILDATGKVIDAHWVSGDDRLRPLTDKLRGQKFPVEAPTKEPLRVAVRLAAACSPPLGCGVFTLPMTEAR